MTKNAMIHTIGGRILALRDDKKVSQLELAAALGISTSALRNIENGSAMPRYNTLVQLSDFFKVSIDYLVHGVYSDSPEIDIYKKSGLNDLSMSFLSEQMEIAKLEGEPNLYAITLNALMSEGLLDLVWELNWLNDELAENDKKLKKNEKEQDTNKHYSRKFKLQEDRELKKLRFLRHVEKLFERLIIEEEGDE